VAADFGPIPGWKRPVMYLEDNCAAATSAPSAMRTPWWFSYLQSGDVCNVAAWSAALCDDITVHAAHGVTSPNTSRARLLKPTLSFIEPIDKVTITSHAPLFKPA
jgi:hypothetical protein